MLLRPSGLGSAALYRPAHADHDAGGAVVAVLYQPVDAATVNTLAVLSRTSPDGACCRLALWPEKPGPLSLTIDGQHTLT